MVNKKYEQYAITKIISVMYSNGILDISELQHFTSKIITDDSNPSNF